MISFSFMISINKGITVEQHLNSTSTPNKEEITQPRLKSTELFRTAREIVIEHDDDEYRLRLTRQGKLILTK